MSDLKTEVLFYHLDRQPLERVLPGLLERTLERGWRAVVQTGSEERLEALNVALWTFAEGSFIPHGARADGHATEQPIYLTTGTDTPNGAVVRFFVDGAEGGDLSGLVRAVFLFDGSDPDATASARVQWQAVKAAGHAATYWRQSPEGRWEKKA